jgi:hypothetical protein
VPIEVLREKIKTQLNTLSSIERVYDYPTEDFQGFPAAIIRSAGNESDYETTAENERHYIFEVFLLQESESELRSRREARRIIESSVDEILDLIDKDEFLSGIVLPSGKIMLGIIPVASEIVDLDKYVATKLTLTIRISVNIT